MALDIDSLIARSVAQGDELHALMETVRLRKAKRVEARDRIRHDLQDALVFQQSQNTTQELVFNVPHGHAFECVRLMLLPEVRSVTIDASTTGPDDLVYRPVAWIGAGTQVIANSAVDAQIEIGYVAPDGSERQYQNKPFFASQCFSSPLNLNERVYDALVPALANCCQYDGNSYGRGLEFEPFLEVMPGTALTMQITPVFSGTKQVEPAYGADGRIYEYRIRGVIEGYKRVRQ